MTLSKDKKDDIILKIGRYGIYLERGEEKANLPDEFGPENVSYDMAEEMFRLKAKDDESIATLDGENIFIKTGRFGSYLNCGDKNKGFPPNVDADNITKELAKKIISLPYSIGQDENKDDVKIDIGKFGPYIRCGKKTKSIPPSKDLFDLSLNEAIELLNTKQSSGRVLGKDKESGKEIELKRGRFGFYVTDGKINASLKNGEDIEITLEQAIEKITAKAKK
jgi:DNA topoisomerase-1